MNDNLLGVILIVALTMVAWGVALLWLARRAANRRRD
jgi:hypothetical protein